MEFTFAGRSFVELILALTGLVFIFDVLRTRFRRGLRDVPGPFLASISNIDRVWSCATGLQMNYHLKLHEKYGPLVRIGPNHVSFADSSLINLVYDIKSRFYKVTYSGTCIGFKSRSDIYRAISTPCLTSTQLPAGCPRSSLLEMKGYTNDSSVLLPEHIL